MEHVRQWKYYKENVFIRNENHMLSKKRQKENLNPRKTISNIILYN